MNINKAEKMPLLSVKNMSVSFQMYKKGLQQIDQVAIKDISIEVERGEIVAVVGSSGSGKSLLAHGILQILPNNATMGGQVLFDGHPVDEKNKREYQGKKIALVPQSISYLDPLMITEKQVFETSSIKPNQKIFEDFGLKKEDAKKYPFQLSGGMARRVLVMTSAVSDAELIIADEPTPGLNPKLAQEILSHFRKMADDGKGVLLITHDIDLVCEVADRIAIFYGGTILETTSVDNFMTGPSALVHPYSKALWRALPQNNFEAISLDDLKRECNEGGFVLPDRDHVMEEEEYA